jgi:hypothetical protein
LSPWPLCIAIGRYLKAFIPDAENQILGSFLASNQSCGNPVSHFEMNFCPFVINVHAREIRAQRRMKVIPLFPKRVIASRASRGVAIHV